MDPHPQELPDDDDAAAEALADAWIEEAAKDPRLLLIARRAAGLVKQPAEMTLEELARHLGTDRYTVLRIAHKALKKLRYIPELKPLNPKH